MSETLPVRKGRLGEALSWAPAERIGVRAIAIAVLGMSAPALIGIAVHRPEIGFTIGLGAMLLADTPSAASVSGAGAEASAMRGSTLLPAALAVALATALSGEPWSDVAMILLTGVAAAISGYSRPVAVAAIRFIIYFILSFTLLQNAGAHRGAAALIFGLGALWNMVIRLLLAGRKPQPGRDITDNAAAATARIPTQAQRRAHWRRTMRTLAGWQFPIRIAVGLALADGARLAFPSHHYGWIVLSVALLTQRPIEHLPIKILQRTLGTLAGVSLTWGMLLLSPPAVVLAVMICLLAAATYLARSRNYLLYSSLSTPVILLVLDLGKPIEIALLTDRLVATLVGAAIVVVLNVLMDRLTAPREAPARAGAPEKPLTRSPARRPTRAMMLVVNGEARAAEGGATLSALVAELGLDPRKVAVERNLEIVPRSLYAATNLLDGDRIEIVHFIGGG